jgi:hypothetical protein
VLKLLNSNVAKTGVKTVAAQYLMQATSAHSREYFNLGEAIPSHYRRRRRAALRSFSDSSRGKRFMTL